MVFLGYKRTEISDEHSDLFWKNCMPELFSYVQKYKEITYFSAIFAVAEYENNCYTSCVK